MKISLFLAGTVVIICFLVNSVVFYQKITSNLNYKRWDLNHTTAADFAVELVLTEKHWRLWNRHKENQEKLEAYMSVKTESVQFHQYFVD